MSLLSLLFGRACFLQYCKRLLRDADDTDPYQASAALYVVDTYGALNGSSAIAANSLVRYIAGAAFPLFTIQSSCWSNCSHFFC